MKTTIGMLKAIKIGKGHGRLLVGGAAAVLLAGCTTLTVRSDYDASASFAGLQTYTWVDAKRYETGNPAIDNPLLADRIRASVDELLEPKGFRRLIAPGTPDLRLSYGLVARETTRTYYGGGYGYYGTYGYRFGHFGRFGQFGRFGHFGHFGPGSYGPYYQVPALRGTLVLNVIAAENSEVIWSGWASGLLSDDPTPEDVDRYVLEALQEILAEFPPEPEEGKHGFMVSATVTCSDATTTARITRGRPALHVERPKVNFPGASTRSRSTLP